jgi:hypothetical protein
MLPSVQALFSGIIDYAGLFPPAQLPLEQAIRNYARYQQEPESWMLGRFVCPLKQVSKLWPHVRPLFSADSEIRISAVASGQNTAAELRAAFATDTVSARAVVDSIEMTFSPESLAVIAGERLPDRGPESDLTTALQAPESPRVFFEVPRGAEWDTALRTVVESLKKTDDKRKGIKLRCGGPAATAIPSVAEVAYAITACRDARVPLKFTAGLHHPLRHFDEALRALVHGFLNVFAAGVLAHVHDLTAQQLTPILEEEDPGAFRFDGAHLHWKEWSVPKGQIEAARRELVQSFGSCSFEEPRDDLRALGLIP